MSYNRDHRGHREKRYIVIKQRQRRYKKQVFSVSSVVSVVKCFSSLLPI